MAEHLAKFEFAVSGIEISEQQKQRISAGILTVINDALTEGSPTAASGTLWGVCRVNGGMVYAGKIAQVLAETAAKAAPATQSFLQ